MSSSTNRIKKRQVPKYKRSPEKVGFVLTSRDNKILEVLNQYRYLRTGQIQQLVFADNTTAQGTRRRLKKLYHHKYIGRITPYMQLGKPVPEIAYYLDKKGITLLSEQGIPCKSGPKVGKVKHQFLQHALNISDFRILLERSLNGHSVVKLGEFLADFELKRPTQNAVGRRRYQLFDEVIYKSARKKYIVYPDSLIVLSALKSEHQALYFLEIDRGTEGLSKIREKITGYRLYLEQEIHRKYCDVNSFTVLIQTNSKRRAENIYNTLIDHAGAHLVWIGYEDEVNQCKNLVSDPIWIDSEGNKKAILK